MTKFRSVAAGVAVAATLMLQACYYPPAYTAVPAGPTPQQRFDQSWQAALGAASDEGVRITQQDRGSGTIHGDKGAASVLITVVTQADSSINVAITVSGLPDNDTLKDRLTNAYRRRMGV